MDDQEIKGIHRSKLLAAALFLRKAATYSDNNVQKITQIFIFLLLKNASLFQLSSLHTFLPIEIELSLELTDDSGKRAALTPK